MTIAAYILMLILCCPNHPLNRRPELREEVAGYIEGAAEQYDIPAPLLARWGYEESSLRRKAVGPKRALGVGQVRRIGRRLCRVEGYDPLSWRGGIFCMAMLMDMGRRVCGSLERGLFWYASGSCKGTPRARRVTRGRLRAARKWMGKR
jgi:hypothetical protein